MSLINETVGALLHEYAANPSRQALVCRAASLSTLQGKQFSFVVFESAGSNVNGFREPQLTLNNLSNSTTSTSTTTESSGAPALSHLRVDYDYDEAFYYFVFILLWYSLGVIALIRLQIKKNQLHYYDDSDDPDDQNTAQNMLKRIRTENVKREALGKWLIKINKST
jgi:hypothetical protein